MLHMFFLTLLCSPNEAHLMHLKKFCLHPPNALCGAVPKSRAGLHACWSCAAVSPWFAGRTVHAHVWIILLSVPGYCLSPPLWSEKLCPLCILDMQTSLLPLPSHVDCTAWPRKNTNDLVHASVDSSCKNVYCAWQSLIPREGV